MAERGLCRDAVRVRAGHREPVRSFRTAAGAAGGGAGARARLSAPGLCPGDELAGGRADHRGDHRGRVSRRPMPISPMSPRRKSARPASA
jgi:hypothetical protein